MGGGAGIMMPWVGKNQKINSQGGERRLFGTREYTVLKYAQKFIKTSHVNEHV